ncbi:MAG: hypothetical protein DMG58_14690 [Acidobacteria bacterium]|nr:MAG: hypothetical protein DMG58_14690 [Acidobacteriota bacterium]
MTQLTRILFVVPLIASLGPMTISSLLASEPSTPQASWNNLGNLARGDEVKVVVNHASAQRGAFQSMTGDAMVVHFPTGDQTFERQSVTQVLVKRDGHRGRHALIGLLVGTGAGLGVGAASDVAVHDNWFPNFGKGLFTPAGAIVGATIGALVPSGGWKKIYEAR